MDKDFHKFCPPQILKFTMSHGNLECRLEKQTSYFLPHTHTKNLYALPESQVPLFIASSFESGNVNPMWKRKSLRHVQLSVSPWTTVHGILQVRILEWVALSFSRD